MGITFELLNGRWLHVNQRLCDILGYSLEELRARDFQDVTYPEDVAADDLARQQFLAGEIQSYSREKRYVRRDGLVVWVDVIVTLQRSPAGEPKFFITVVQDITERKKLEQQFLQSQKMEAVGQLAGGIAHASIICLPQSPDTANSVWRVCPLTTAYDATSKRSKKPETEQLP